MTAVGALSDTPVEPVPDTVSFVDAEADIALTTVAALLANETPESLAVPDTQASTTAQVTTVAPTTTTTPTTAAPATLPPPTTVPPPPVDRVSYANCDAVRAAGAAPIKLGDPGFESKFDRDNDGIGCEI